ncbi:MFS transporter [Glaciecola siphonariae]|uniref:MFS transporter n=1 Tax=Glaciecola siphonariae TaxID=521012 RepID=A0ABV9LR50_9ALTE
MREQQVALHQVVVYALSIVPIAALALPLSIFIPPFYAQSPTLTVGMVGLIFALARLWDFFTDLGLGWLIDRYPSRYGKRKHWVVISLPILMVSSWNLYVPPEDAGIFYLSIWLFFLYIGFTLLLINHYAWAPELTTQVKQRARLYGWRDAALVFGILLSVTGPAMLEKLSGANLTEQVNSIGIFLMISLPMAVCALVLVLPDQRTNLQVPQQVFRRGWYHFRQHAAFRLPIILDFSTGIAQSITTSIFVFAASFAYGHGESATQIILVNFIAGFLAFPLWIKLTQRFGTHTVFSWALIYTIFACLVLFFIPKHETSLFILAVGLYGIGMGPPMFLTRTLMASAIDLTSERGEAPLTSFGFSLMTMSNKIAGALAVGLSYGLLSLIGFDANAETVSESVEIWLRIIFSLGPLLFYGIALYALYRKMRAN